MDTQIHEPVEVIAYFHNLQIEVVKFKWNSSIYNVSNLNSYWKIPSGNSFEYHFTLECSKQSVLCELSFNLNDFKWQLVQLENI